jgi:hypothetical protein
MNLDRGLRWEIRRAFRIAAAVACHWHTWIKSVCLSYILMLICLRLKFLYTVSTLCTIQFRPL